MVTKLRTEIDEIHNIEVQITVVTEERFHSDTDLFIQTIRKDLIKLC